ncbi:hypothetical protein F4802DRAFT_153426 [Xylaria palmicola]|nr:hypothetical protein F4802DRAFT_153426 [Xylaria palmicola]
MPRPLTVAFRRLGSRGLARAATSQSAASAFIHPTGRVVRAHRSDGASSCRPPSWLQISRLTSCRLSTYVVHCCCSASSPPDRHLLTSLAMGPLGPFSLRGLDIDPVRLQRRGTPQPGTASQPFDHFWPKAPARFRGGKPLVRLFGRAHTLASL